MGEIVNIIFGPYTLIEVIGYLWFFIIGYLIYGLNETSNRDVDSKNTPTKWSWYFWFRDNWRRYVTTILSTYVLFRFYEDINGQPFGYFDAVTMGLIGDGIGATIKKKVKGLGADRKKIMENMSSEELE